MPVLSGGTRHLIKSDQVRLSELAFDSFIVGKFRECHSIFGDRVSEGKKLLRLVGLTRPSRHCCRDHQRIAMCWVGER